MEVIYESNSLSEFEKYIVHKLFIRRSCSVEHNLVQIMVNAAADTVNQLSWRCKRSKFRVLNMLDILRERVSNHFMDMIVQLAAKVCAYIHHSLCFDANIGCGNVWREICVHTHSPQLLMSVLNHMASITSSNFQRHLFSLNQPWVIWALHQGWPHSTSQSWGFAW
jgi:hypothetical protein